MFKKSVLFTIYSILFIFGSLLANFFNFDALYSFIILLCLIVVSSAVWKKKKVVLVLLGMACIFLGMWRFGLSADEINQSHIGYYAKSKIEFRGQVVDEPDIRDKHGKLTLGKIEGLQGKILVNAANYPLINYGDWLNIKCRVEEPGMVEEFDYGKFLGAKGIEATCPRPDEIKIIKGGLSSWQKFRGKILKVKYSYSEIIKQSVAYPESEILSAMVLGLRRGIPENILENFRASGLSHIIAISGLHISIVTLLLMNMLMAIGLRRRYAFPAAAVSLIIFLIMIGFRASSIRAGIMGLTALLALQLGRLNRSINALLLAAVVLLLINPKLLLDDVGFQLSFLAVAGIIYMGEYVEKFLAKIKIPEALQIRSSLMMTLSAQALVLPLIVYYFGNLSLIAPLANVLVLPLLPIVMVVGFILGLAGFIYLPLAKLIGYGVSVLISWVVGVAEKLSGWPGANYEIGGIDIVWVISIYMLAAWVIWLVKSKKRYGQE